MPRRDRQRLVVCPVGELPPGARRVLRTDRGRTIVVYNVNGVYHALGSICPHQGGPVGVDDGLVTGTTRMRLTCDDRLEPEWIREGEIVRCGWHLYEFDIATGRALTDDRMRLATYPVRIEAGEGGQATVVVEA